MSVVDRMEIEAGELSGGRLSLQPEYIEKHIGVRGRRANVGKACKKGVLSFRR